MVLRLASPPGQPQWSLHEIFKGIFAHMADREHYALGPYHINRHLHRAAECSLHFNHQWILEAFLTFCPQRITNPRTNASVTLHWYVPDELGDHIAHPHKLKLHARIPMALLLRAFPDLELTQRPNSSRVTLSEASMRALSVSFVERFNGTVAQVEAVGPGDGYHFTFGTTADQEAALRFGLVLPGDPTQTLPFLRIDDPDTRIPPFCSTCGLYNAHRGEQCPNPYRCMECGDVGHSKRNPNQRVRVSGMFGRRWKNIPKGGRCNERSTP